MTRDLCEFSDLPKTTCWHCGARPGDRTVPERPWSFNGVTMTRRSGRDLWPSVEAPDVLRRPLKTGISHGGTCTCGKPTRDNAYVCDDCLDDLSKALGNVPWLVEQLGISLTKSRGIDYARDNGNHQPSIPLAHVDVHDDGDAQADRATILPYHDGAAAALAGLRQALVMWCRFCDEESIRHQSPISKLPADTLQAMSAWLLWRVDGLGLSDLGPDAAVDITSAVTRCHSTIDRPAERRYVGPCECGRDLYSKIGAKITQCPACERDYDVEAMRAWMRAGITGRLVTAKEGATLLGRFDLPTPQKTIDKWHERKRLVDHGANAAGARLYLIDDIIGLAAQNTAKLA